MSHYVPLCSFGLLEPFLFCLSLLFCPLDFLANPEFRSGSLEVRLYYGTEKKEVLGDLMNEQILLRRVVVLTTYQTLEYEYRQQVNLTKVQCQWCGRLYQKEKLFYHQRYFCGPDAQRTEKQMKARRKADYKDWQSRALP